MPVYRPIDIACRHANPNGFNCAAQSGELCRWSDGKAAPGNLFHAERIEDAAAVSDAGGAPDLKAFEAAVESSGEV